MKKKIIISITILFLLVIGFILVAPSIFKKNILNFVQTEASKSIDGELKIGDLDLSLFRDFPSVSLKFTDVSIIENEALEGDTLMNIPLFEVVANIKSIISGDEIIINKILIEKCDFKPTVNIDNSSIWNAVKSKAGIDGKAKTNKPDSKKRFIINSIIVDNMNFIYNNYKNSTYLSVDNINLSLNGDLSKTDTELDLILSLDNISFRDGNSVWVNNTDLEFNTRVMANLDSMTFNIEKGDLLVNKFKLNLKGDVNASELDNYKLNLELNANDTKFENLLELVPENLQNHIDDITTTGNFNFNIKTNGNLSSNNIPAFDMHLAVNNASLKYNKLPESIDDINIDLNITNKGGSIDSTTINLKKASLSITNNPFSLFAKIKNINDPIISGGAVGVINFGDLRKAIPMKDITLRGVIDTDMTFDGKYSYIEKKEYDKFTAKGKVDIKDVLLINDKFPDGISIKYGNIIITPKQLNVNNISGSLRSSNFTLQGDILNYLPYIFKNEMLEGNFMLKSKFINLNELSQPTIKSGTTNKSSAATGAIEIPKNINVNLSTNISYILADKLVIKDVKGDILLKEGVATLNDLSMNLLKGKMVMNGKYDTKNPKIPKIAFNINIINFDINSMYHSFSSIKHMAPMAIDCKGLISSSLSINSDLDKDMSLKMNTLNGNGYFSSKGVAINDNPTMSQLSPYFKNDGLNISKLKVNFEIKGGDITISPFTTLLSGNKLTIFGTQTLDGKLDYTLSMNIKRASFGKEITKILGSIPGSKNIQDLDVDAKIGGTLDKPTVKPDLSKALKKVTSEAAKELNMGGLLDGLKGLFK